ncbi:hypothetical protein H4684_003299 [Desulfomicrobium macestii]|uniref:Uncharacterized protein n=1 Tax=Desulfomicrobium macestii TaxID=90731 RepID=A0ABR9H7E7_9BACT|nr:hypothetical protein [Desulfomicrobium macestii]MBE1426633.1 hypothetical protein [Desulfomicrobium macestii]
MPARVIINEQHSLNPAQGRILGERFGSYESIKIPAQGLSRAQQEAMAADLMRTIGPVVFISPVPLLLAIMAGNCGRSLAVQDSGRPRPGTPPVFLFHNDLRSKTETGEGRITSTIAPKGWELILL